MIVHPACREQLAAAHRQARSLKDTTLCRSLRFLNQFLSQTGGRCYLFGDRAPYSFGWEIRLPDGSVIYTGGLLYYGPHESGVGAPQYSVSLDESGKPRWEIHS